eukprot:scaffold1307_cov200-Pinguiococcus_pyrenoidosus.AAC.95
MQSPSIHAWRAMRLGLTFALGAVLRCVVFLLDNNGLLSTFRKDALFLFGAQLPHLPSPRSRFAVLLAADAIHSTALYATGRTAAVASTALGEAVGWQLLNPISVMSCGLGRTWTMELSAFALVMSGVSTWDERQTLFPATLSLAPVVLGFAVLLRLSLTYVPLALLCILLLVARTRRRPLKSAAETATDNISSGMSRCLAGPLTILAIIGLLVAAWASLDKEALMASLGAKRSEAGVNLGFRWYLAAEMFPEFSAFFEVILAGHLYLHVWPLYYRLSERPGAAVGMTQHGFQALVMGTFMLPFRDNQSPATLVTIAAFWWQRQEAVKQMRRGVLLLVVLLASASLPFAVVSRSRWLYYGVANANHLFSAAGLYNLALVLFSLEAAGAELRSQLVECSADENTERRGE